MGQKDKEVVIKKKDSKIVIGVKEGKQPAVYIDGVKYPYAVIDLLNPEKIEKIVVLKGEEALEKYKDSSVLLITTKKELKAVIGYETKVESIKNNVQNVRLKLGEEFKNSNVLLVIDDKIRSEEEFNKIEPKDIESVTVIKSKQDVMEMYGKEANGAIIIKMKKK